MDDKKKNLPLVEKYRFVCWLSFLCLCFLCLFVLFVSFVCLFVCFLFVLLRYCFSLSFSNLSSKDLRSLTNSFHMPKSYLQVSCLT